ncbi:B3 domain-containing protein REM7-like isoform X2 [Chenopodium quinoa]|uniref:B3 domain-containing protein REM7-like isoform X2 n=1 Tax=Chenopodium quinoa TaxID=63459 RepID=UPI000B775098|nr:B3 domain-containing protein REM7-like isoform X2 [Chenopodium quinoa]
MRLFHPRKPHFFQPLIPGFLSNFSIPKSFYKYLGLGAIIGEKMALLRDKSKKIWDVKIELINNKVQFKDGWEIFCKDHDLQIGDLLVFMHQGYWVFDVFVFDSTACEREFATIDDESNQSNYVIVQALSSCGVKNNSGATLNEAKDVAHEGLSRENNNDVLEQTNMGSRPSTFVLQNCSYESVALSIPKPINIGVGSEIGENKMALLRDKSKKIWDVKIELSKNKVQFKDGWDIFCEDHDLQIGDFLELKYQDVDEGLSNRTENKKIQEQKTIGFKPTGHPYCTLVLMNHSYKSAQLFIPLDFARKIGLDKRQYVVIDEKGRKWVLPFEYTKGKHAYIGKLRGLYIANDFKIGDFVILELIQSGKEPVIKFHNLLRL